jgi:hypothetical protein
VGEQHFDLFPTAASDLIFRRCSKGARHITGDQSQWSAIRTLFAEIEIPGSKFR